MSEDTLAKDWDKSPKAMIAEGKTKLITDILYLLDGAVTSNNEINYGDEDEWKHKLYEAYRQYKDKGYDMETLTACKQDKPIKEGGEDERP